MKKLFLGMLAIVTMIATSCVQDQSQDLGVNLGETVSVSFNVGTATRAYSDGSLATNLEWAVYDKDGVLLTALQGLDNAFNGQKNFAIDLAKGDTYSMVFWAYANNAPYSLDLATKTVTVDYTIAKSNDEKRDAFYAYTSFTVEANTVVSVQLKRPFAQLNIGASDFATMANAGRDITLSKVVVDTYTTLNLASGEVEGAAEQTFDYANLPTEAFVVNPNTFGYLAMNYVLVGNGAETVDVEIHFAAGEPENVTYSDSRTVGSVPVQRNYRTNIYGKILTTSVDFNVEIEPEYEEDNNIETIKSAAQLFAAFAKGGAYTLLSDIVVDSVPPTTLAATRSNGVHTIVDLNGHTITVENKGTEALYEVAPENTITFTGEGTIELTNESTAPFVDNSEGTIEVAGANVVDNANTGVFSDNNNYVDYVALLREAFQNGGEYTMVYDVAIAEGLKLANGKSLVLNLNGKTISGTDNATGSYGLITNNGDLTVVGPGALVLKATNNRNWNAYSSVISNSVGGNLVVDGGVVIEHLGGTDMAYGIDNLTNGKGTSAVTTVKNATVKSTYRAIRQFLNGVEATNDLYVKAGAVIEGTNKSIWMQDPSKNANTGKLVVEEGATLNGDVYLYVCEGSTEWPVEVSIAASAVNGKVLTGNVPSGKAVENVDGVWTIVKCYEEIYDGETIVGYEIKSAAGLTWISSEILGGNNFAGKTIKLTADIDLTGVTTNGDSFGPIGRYCSGQGVNMPFTGNFDGQGHTIKGIYQSGWDFGYEWGTTGYLGLFGYVKDATIENLTIEGMESVVEGGTLAAIAGRADGECTFKNITVKNTKLGTYNNRCGGIVGWTGGYYKDEAQTEVACHFTFENIVISEDVVLGGLWGSFDSSIGGVMGQLNSAGTASFKNVTVSCRIDAYNDCTASYDYYLYRMCGMLIGQMTKTTEIDGSTYPDVAAYGITFDNVTVNYGKWMNYHYCEPTPGLNGGRGMRVEAGFTYDGLPSDFDHTQCVDNHYNCIPFDQLFGGTQTACKGVKAWDGVTVNYPAAYTCDLCGQTHNAQ